jgi:hypothetical protein
MMLITMRATTPRVRTFRHQGESASNTVTASRNFRRRGGRVTFHSQVGADGTGHNGCTLALAEDRAARSRRPKIGIGDT